MHTSTIDGAIITRTISLTNMHVVTLYAPEKGPMH